MDLLLLLPVVLPSVFLFQQQEQLKTQTTVHCLTSLADMSVATINGPSAITPMARRVADEPREDPMETDFEEEEEEQPPETDFSCQEH